MEAVERLREAALDALAESIQETARGIAHEIIQSDPGGRVAVAMREACRGEPISPQDVANFREGMVQAIRWDLARRLLQDDPVERAREIVVGAAEGLVVVRRLRRGMSEIELASYLDGVREAVDNLHKALEG